MSDDLDRLINAAFPPAPPSPQAVARVIAATAARATNQPRPMAWTQALAALLRPPVLLRYAMPMAAAAMVALAVTDLRHTDSYGQTASLMDSYSVFAAGYR